MRVILYAVGKSHIIRVWVMTRRLLAAAIERALAALIAADAQACTVPCTIVGQVRTDARADLHNVDCIASATRFRFKENEDLSLGRKVGR